MRIVRPHPDTRTDMVSDVLQATKAVLIDTRGEAIITQIQFVGMTQAEALKWLQEAVTYLEEL